MQSIFTASASIASRMPGKSGICGLLLVMLMLFAPVVEAAPPTTTSEIEQLIAALGASGCDFQRNGSWHPAKKAEEHLRRKYEWLRERNKVATAEQFIELAGTRSSMSGRVYRVRCAGTPATASAEWLRARLAEIRKRDVIRTDAR